MKLEVTRDEWVDSVLLAWKSGKSIGSAVAVAFEMDREDCLKSSQWEAAIEKLKGVRPSLGQAPFLKKQVSVWIADDFVNASKALFDGRVGDAARWLTSGKDVKRKRLPKKPLGRPSHVRVFVPARSLDNKSTAWNVVK